MTIRIFLIPVFIAVGFHFSCFSALAQSIDVQSPSASTNAITNGHLLIGNDTRRSGFVRIHVTNAQTSGNCTAAILKSSRITNDAWLLTAAHCFYKLDKNDFGVHKAGTNFTITVDHGAGLGTNVAATSTVHIHPEWETEVNGGFGIWLDQPDIALVHFDAYIPVQNEDGLEYVEFTRPFFSGVMKHYEGKDVGVFGARDIMKWARGQFHMSTEGYIVIDPSDWRTQDALIEFGDSGGPWIYSTGENSSAEAYVMDGVVIAVTSAGFVDRSPTSLSLSGNLDFFAMGLSRPSQTDFILNTTQHQVPHVDSLPWRRKRTVQYSENGVSSWTRLPRTARNTGSVAIGDFGTHACDAGVKRDDLFLTENGRWFVSWCGTTDWEPINRSNTELDDEYRLVLGDFNGDGIADIFRAAAGEWKVSFSGTEPWTKINASNTQVTDTKGLGFGDFNGDGITDVFRASEGKWRVSYSGTGPWAQINTSSTEFKDEHGLALGDFNGDGITDVFRASEGKWRVSYSGTGSWAQINSSSTKLTDKYGLVFGFFNSDAKTDVLRGNGTKWFVSYGGASAWSNLLSSQTTTRQLAVGYLNPDRKSDVVLVQRKVECDTAYGNLCPLHYHLNNTAPRR